MWQYWFLGIVIWLITSSYAAYLFGRHAGNPRGAIYISWQFSFVWPITLLVAWIIFLYRVGYSEGES